MGEDRGVGIRPICFDSFHKIVRFFRVDYQFNSGEVALGI